MKQHLREMKTRLLLYSRSSDGTVDIAIAQKGQFIHHNGKCKVVDRQKNKLMVKNLRTGKAEHLTVR